MCKKIKDLTIIILHYNDNNTFDEFIKSIGMEVNNYLIS